jgi:hypothetical protein
MEWEVGGGGGVRIPADESQLVYGHDRRSGWALIV